MFAGVSFTGGGANAPFYGSFTTNVVATCQDGGTFYGLTADLNYDATLKVTVSGLNGATLTQGTRLVVDTAGVKSGTSVLRLSVQNKSLKNGQTAAIRLQNVKGTCEGGTNTASAVKTVKFVERAPQPEKAPEPTPEPEQEPEPEVSLESYSVDELLTMLGEKDLPEARANEIRAAVSAKAKAEGERAKTLESQLAECVESATAAEAAEPTGWRKYFENKWVFLGIGAVMTALVAGAVAIVVSLTRKQKKS